MIFLFPSDYFNINRVDEAYSEQKTCLQDLGFEVSVVSLESLGSSSLKILPNRSSGEVVYRGWMLSVSDYELLVNTVKNTGASLLVSKDQYVATHYIPNWYPKIADLTPETKFYTANDDLESELNQLGWNRFFVKDYVKSLKTSVGSMINSSSAIKTVVTEMQKFRGSIEGGICVRQVEDFVPKTERRYFVVNNKAFAATPSDEIPKIVEECVKRISSPFFSVDVIHRRDGQERIVEIGDGQVSDLIGWSAERFALVMRSLSN